MAGAALTHLIDQLNLAAWPHKTQRQQGVTGEPASNSGYNSGLGLAATVGQATKFSWWLWGPVLKRTSTPPKQGMKFLSPSEE
jgi:hypothetical protein